jgi:hypothetical protein
VCGQHHAPAAFTRGKDPVPIVQEVGWAPEPVWIGVENLAPPGFDPRTFQPVASRYTDYAIPAPSETKVVEEYCWAMTGGGTVTLRPITCRFAGVWNQIGSPSVNTHMVFQMRTRFRLAQKSTRLVEPSAAQLLRRPRSVCSVCQALDIAL